MLPALPSLDPAEPAPRLQEHFAERSVGRACLHNRFEDPESLVCLLAKSNVFFSFFFFFSIAKSSV